MFGTVDTTKIIRVFIAKEHLVSVPDNLVIYDENCYHLFKSLGTKDHPIFTRSRNWLHQNGYIIKEENLINGDNVLKQFYLNNHLLKVGEKFACAAYWGIHLRNKKKRKLDKILRKRLHAKNK